MLKNIDLHYLVSVFVSNNVEQTDEYLNKLGVSTKNPDGTYKPFNKVMEQIYALSVQ